MATLFQIGKYGAINTTDMTTMGYYMIKLFSESRKLQEDTPCDGQISTYGELICQSTLHELCAILYKGEMGTKTTTKKIIFPTCKIAHPCLDVMSATEAKKIPNNLCNRNQ